MRKIKRYWSVEGDIRVANKFSLSKHRDMWLWLSENPNRKRIGLSGLILIFLIGLIIVLLVVILLGSAGKRIASSVL